MAVLATAPTLLDELFGDTCVEPAARKAGGERTLDEMIVGAWEALTTHLATRCPMCDGELIPQYGAHSRPVAGRCRDCGTVLS